MDSGSCAVRGFIRRLLLHDVGSNQDQIACSTQENSSETARVDASLENMASTSGISGGHPMYSEEFVRHQSGLLSLQPWIFRKEVRHDDAEKMGDASDCFDKHRYKINGLANGFDAEVSMGSIGPRKSYRSRWSRRDYVRPLEPTESCIIPRLYADFEIKEYVLSSIPSSSAALAMRPLLITDGKTMISRSSYATLGNALENGLNEEVGGISSGVMGSMAGVPTPSESRKSRSGKVQNRRIHASVSPRSPKPSHPPGLLDGVFLLCLGISIGIMSTILSNRREMEKLNDMLRHTENLVQDLQEELIMKDSLTVKELANEPCGSQELTHSAANMEKCFELSQNQTPTSKSPAQERHVHDQPHLPKHGEIPELRSKMEAELEAELEILEKSISTSLEQRMASFNELDQGLIAEAVYGELGADTLDRGSEACVDTIRDTNSTCTTATCSMNYAASPRELALRLHEVIESRLEEQVMELEKALQHSQRKLRLMEVARLQRDFSSSDIGSSSNQDSPKQTGLESAVIHPFCLNLSGCALDAYDEAYEEFMRMTEIEENLPSAFTKTGGKIDDDEFYISDLSLIWDLGGGRENKSTNSKFKK